MFPAIQYLTITYCKKIYRFNCRLQKLNNGELHDLPFSEVFPNRIKYLENK